MISPSLSAKSRLMAHRTCQRSTPRSSARAQIVVRPLHSPTRADILHRVGRKSTTPQSTPIPAIPECPGIARMLTPRTHPSSTCSSSSVHVSLRIEHGWGSQKPLYCPKSYKIAVILATWLLISGRSSDGCVFRRAEKVDPRRGARRRGQRSRTVANI